ncbi:MAG: cyclodeaminase/cyclohydrolase family protein [Clostridia bacterium]|nr:cyclodeaminase/cyclohydrolase family protein [Clostridia bacterium]
MNTETFLQELASKEPVPGGGGASALIGAVGAALCSMVGNLTAGKKKYAEYEDDIQRILAEAETRCAALFALIDEDAAAFRPLAEAYGIPKDDPARGERMEAALLRACEPPMAMLREVFEVVKLAKELTQKGSRLAVSDVGVAAAACRCALQGAIMNVYINTKSMIDREKAAEIDAEATRLLTEGAAACNAVYAAVTAELRG